MLHAPKLNESIELNLTLRELMDALDSLSPGYEPPPPLTLPSSPDDSSSPAPCRAGSYNSPPPPSPFQSDGSGLDEDDEYLTAVAQGGSWWLDGSLPTDLPREDSWWLAGSLPEPLQSPQHEDDDGIPFLGASTSWDGGKTFEPLSLPGSPSPTHRGTVGSPSSTSSLIIASTMHKEATARRKPRSSFSPSSSPLARRRQEAKEAAHMLLQGVGRLDEGELSPTDIAAQFGWQVRISKDGTVSC